MPKKTAVPSAWRNSAPAPIAQTNGVTPRMNANDVISIGRNRRPRGFDGGIPPTAALIFKLPGEFDDQDGVLGGKPDQHHEPDLGEDIVVLPAQDDAGDGGNQAHRYDQDHRKRQRQALVLRRKHKEYKHHRQDEGEHGGIAGPDLLEGERRPFGGETLRQRFVRELVHDRDALSLRIARRGGAIHFGGGIEIVVRHTERTGNIVHGGERAERYGIAVGVAHADFEHVATSRRSSSRACAVTRKVRPNKLKSLT